VAGEGIRVSWLGTVPYAEALELQRACVTERLAGDAPDRLLLLEHPPVVTLGRGASEENLLVPPDALRARGIELHRVGRGGDVTYHGPGQLVGYPIIDLDARAARDVHAFLRLLEGGLIEVLATFGVAAKRISGMTGVYVDLERSPRPSPGGSGRERKIASIGIGVRRWVTFHGFALNLTLDLADFETIVPCGLGDVEMTSLARELPGDASVEAPDLEARARAAVGDAFRRRFA
jgi:lipoyl(octanoyl) transferase